MFMLEDPNKRGSGTKANDVECHQNKKYNTY